jgi:pyruvate kinase
MVSHASETKTKIICTIGPASSDRETLHALIRAGMDVARVNFSHGTRETHAETIRLVRDIAAAEGAVVAVMADLQGPKLRIGRLAAPMGIVAGDWISLTTLACDGTDHVVPLPHPELIAGARVGDRLLLDDGSIEVEVREVRPEVLIGRVVVGGELSSHKGIAAPGGTSRIAALTEKDRADARFAAECGVDFVALSFVRTAGDLAELRRLLDGCEAGGDVGVVAKIEKREAIEHLPEILRDSDAVMIARGDLGVETSPQRVPVLQKEIIRRCNRLGVPVITATQMLQSMVDHPRPTRAEASDVANAILDGSDAVMLSAETAAGRYPVEAVAMIREISAIAEQEMAYRADEAPSDGLERTHAITDAIGKATVRVAREIGAALIVTSTWSGYTARQIARERPRRPIVAFTPRESTLRRLALVWGVTPVLVPPYESTDDMLETVGRVLLERGETKLGDTIVVAGGVPASSEGKTNFIMVRRVEDTSSAG